MHPVFFNGDPQSFMGITPFSHISSFSQERFYDMNMSEIRISGKKETKDGKRISSVV
jgi:hypothetical protein